MSDTTSIAITTLNDHSLSIFTLFYHADWVVKIVIIGLLLLSIICWAIIIEKTRLTRQLNKRADEFDALFWSQKPIDEVISILQNRPKDPITMVFMTANHEGNLAQHDKMDTKIIRVQRAMQATINRQSSFLEKNVMILASTASASPFIGLFGTVWGIMNSFTSIAGAQQVSLAVVAPGIAEALFATAIGLVAAIPATIFYNKISSDIDRYIGRMELFQEEYLTLIERERT